MRYAELFCGAGGGILAHSFLLGHQIMGAAEIEPYPREVLLARQDQGVLPAFPLYGDVSDLDGKRLRGIDVLAGGFPCQGISAAGRKLGINDPRTKLIWEMLRIAHETQAEYIFAENSDRLRSILHLIVPELQKLGYFSVAWCVLGASDLGAYHQRKRMWLMAKRGGPPFVYRWPEAPKKNPACGVLHGDSLAPLKSLVVGAPKRSGMLPTLTCGDVRKSGNRLGAGLWSLSDRLGLTHKCERLRQPPTLTASAWRGPWKGEGLERQLNKRSKPLRDMLPYYFGGNVINPRWAEWFMGWPFEWTDVAQSPSMPSLLKWKKSALADTWWGKEVEKQALPPTLPRRDMSPFQPMRIKALGNGQVPVVAAAAFKGLKELIG